MAETNGSHRIRRRTFLQGAAAAVILAGCGGSKKGVQEAPTGKAPAVQFHEPSRKLSGSLKILMWSHFVPRHDKWFDKFADDWGKKVGVNVRIEQVEWGQWLARVYCRPPCTEPDYDLTIIGHAEGWDIGNYANPKYYFRYDSPEFQALFEASEHTMDDAKRRSLYVRMQKKLVEDAPVVFLFMHPRLAVARRRVEGLWKDLPIPSADLSEVSWAR